LLTFLNINDVNENFNKLKIISNELDSSYNEESLLALAALLSVIRRGDERYEFSIKELHFIILFSVDFEFGRRSGPQQMHSQVEAVMDRELRKMFIYFS
jgi:hypothetical protein